MELTVTVVNINSKVGKEDNSLLKSCHILWEYSELCQRIRERKNKNVKEPYKEAIESCIRDGILIDYLESRGSEVRNMLIAEYDYDMDIEVNREEAREEGIIEEHSKHIDALAASVNSVMVRLGVDSETAMEIMSISEDDRSELRNQLN